MVREKEKSDKNPQEKTLDEIEKSTEATSLSFVGQVITIIIYAVSIYVMFTIIAK